MEHLDEVLSRLDRFFKSYEDLTQASVSGEPASTALVQSEQIARLEQKIDGIACWVQRIDQRFATLVQLFEQQEHQREAEDATAAPGDDAPR